jgi:hypothetical protein
MFQWLSPGKSAAEAGNTTDSSLAMALHETATVSPAAAKVEAAILQM